MLVADSLLHLGQRLGGRDCFRTALRAEPPEIEQGFHRQVVGACALFRQLLGDTDQLEDRRGHWLAAVGGQRVEALDIGVAAVGRHLPIDLREDLLDLAPDLRRRRKTGLAQVGDRVSAAHGRAAEAFHGVAVAAAGQYAGQHHHSNQPPLQQHLHLLKPPRHTAKASHYAIEL
ncbi:hypothetical protein D3C87_1395870 [compost metagenome]